MSSSGSFDISYDPTRRTGNYSQTGPVGNNPTTSLQGTIFEPSSTGVEPWQLVPAPRGWDLDFDNIPDPEETTMHRFDTYGLNYVWPNHFTDFHIPGNQFRNVPTLDGGITTVELGHDELILNWGETAQLRGAFLQYLSYMRRTQAATQTGRFEYQDADFTAKNIQERLLHLAFQRWSQHHANHANQLAANDPKLAKYELASLADRFADPNPANAQNHISPQQLMRLWDEYMARTYDFSGQLENMQPLNQADQALYNELKPYFEKFDAYMLGSVVAQRADDMASSRTPLTQDNLEEFAWMQQNQPLLHFTNPNLRGPNGQQGPALVETDGTMAEAEATLLALLNPPDGGPIDMQAVQTVLDRVVLSTHSDIQTNTPPFKQRWTNFIADVKAAGLTLKEVQVPVETSPSDQPPAPGSQPAPPKTRTQIILTTVDGKPVHPRHANLANELFDLQADYLKFVQQQRHYNNVFANNPAAIGNILTLANVAADPSQARQLDIVFGRFRAMMNTVRNAHFDLAGLTLPAGQANGGKPITVADLHLIEDVDLGILNDRFIRRGINMTYERDDLGKPTLISYTDDLDELVAYQRGMQGILENQGFDFANLSPMDRSNLLIALKNPRMRQAMVAFINNGTRSPELEAAMNQCPALENLLCVGSDWLPVAFESELETNTLLNLVSFANQPASVVSADPTKENPLLSQMVAFQQQVAKAKGGAPDYDALAACVANIQRTMTTQHNAIFSGIPINNGKNQLVQNSEDWYKLCQDLANAGLHFRKGNNNQWGLDIDQGQYDRYIAVLNSQGPGYFVDLQKRLSVIQKNYTDLNVDMDQLNGQIHTFQTQRLMYGHTFSGLYPVLDQAPDFDKNLPMCVAIKKLVDADHAIHQLDVATTYTPPRVTLRKPPTLSPGTLATMALPFGPNIPVASIFQALDLAEDATAEIPTNMQLFLSTIPNKDLSGLTITLSQAPENVMQQPDGSLRYTRTDLSTPSVFNYRSRSNLLVAYQNGMLAKYKDAGFDITRLSQTDRIMILGALSKPEVRQGIINLEKGIVTAEFTTLLNGNPALKRLVELSENSDNPWLGTILGSDLERQGLTNLIAFETNPNATGPNPVLAELVVLQQNIANGGEMNYDEMNQALARIDTLMNQQYLSLFGNLGAEGPGKFLALSQEWYNLAADINQAGLQIQQNGTEFDFVVRDKQNALFLEATGRHGPEYPVQLKQRLLELHAKYAQLGIDPKPVVLNLALFQVQKHAVTGLFEGNVNNNLTLARFGNYWNIDPIDGIRGHVDNLNSLNTDLNYQPPAVTTQTPGTSAFEALTNTNHMYLVFSPLAVSAPTQVQIKTDGLPESFVRNNSGQLEYRRDWTKPSSLTEFTPENIRRTHMISVMDNALGNRQMTHQDLDSLANLFGDKSKWEALHTHLKNGTFTSDTVMSLLDPQFRGSATTVYNLINGNKSFYTTLTSPEGSGYEPLTLAKGASYMSGLLYDNRHRLPTGATFSFVSHQIKTMPMVENYMLASIKPAPSTGSPTYVASGLSSAPAAPTTPSTTTTPPTSSFASSSPSGNYMAPKFYDDTNYVGDFKGITTPLMASMNQTLFASKVYNPTISMGGGNMGDYGLYSGMDSLSFSSSYGGSYDSFFVGSTPGYSSIGGELYVSYFNYFDNSKNGVSSGWGLLDPNFNPADLYSASMNTL